MFVLNLTKSCTFCLSVHASIFMMFATRLCYLLLTFSDVTMFMSVLCFCVVEWLGLLLGMDSLHQHSQDTHTELANMDNINKEFGGMLEKGIAQRRKKVIWAILGSLRRNMTTLYPKYNFFFQSWFLYSVLPRSQVSYALQFFQSFSLAIGCSFTHFQTFTWT